MNKNILIITPGFLPLLGGMEEQVYLLGKEYIRLGNDVTVLTERTKPEFPLNETIEGIGVQRVNKLNSRAFSFPIIFVSYIKHLLKHKYDLIIVRTFTFPAVFTGILKRIGFLKATTVVTAETGGKFDDIENIAKMPFSGLIYYLIKGNDYFNGICSDNLRHLMSHGFPKDKILEIRNGISFDGYKNRKYPTKVNNFLFLGQLNKEKGVWELVNAVKELVKKNNDFKLFIGGDGKEKTKLENFIRINKLEKNIIYQGRILRQNKDTFFAQGECLVLPSYSEGFPLVIIEATKYKKIILVTDVSDIKQIFKNRVFYCNKKSIESVKEQILNIMNRSISGDLNYDDIRNNCDISKVAEQFLQLVTK